MPVFMIINQIRYRTYDDRTFPDNLLGDPTGDPTD